MNPKKYTYLITILLLSFTASANLFYEIIITKDNDNITIEKIELVHLTTGIERPLIGNYFIGFTTDEEQTTFIEGSFFDLPSRLSQTNYNTTTFYKEIIELNQTTIHIPFREDAKILKIHTSTGEQLITKEIKAFKKEEQIEEPHFVQTQREKLEREYQQPEKSVSKNLLTILLGLLALIIIIKIGIRLRNKQQAD